MDDLSYEARKVHRKDFDGMESDDSPEDSKSESSGTNGAGSAEDDSEGARSEGMDSEEMDSDEWAGAEMSAHTNEAVEGDWQDLEQEFATLQSGGAKPSRAAATGSHVKKAAAVETQCRLWNSTLGIRITLQRSLAAADRLPRGPAHKCVIQDVPEAPEAVDTARKAAIDVLHSCMDSMHHLLMQVAPSASKGSVKVAPSSVSTAEQLVQGDREACTALWPQVEDLEDRFSSFRDDELDRWYRKTMLATGRTALKSADGLQALNKPISQQVSDMLQAPDRALRKVQRQRQHHESVLCEPRLHEDSIHAKDVPGGDDSVDTQVDVHAGEGLDEAADAGEEQWQLRRDTLAGAAFDVARDVESFDDSAFYQVLLQEFLESAQTEGLIADTMKVRNCCDPCKQPICPCKLQQSIRGSVICSVLFSR